MASNAPAEADTFPKLLVRNARSFGDRPAMRHKDLGIWQTWTWAQVLDDVRAYAVGLHRLGLKRGDTIAIVGANRPKLYWSVTAAQTLGAIPVPVYADAVADELCYVLAHAEVRFAAVEDQEQVDKILSVSERLPKLETMVYDQPKGLRDYDHTNLHAIDEVIADGRKALAQDATLAAWLDGEIAAGKGSDTSIILYTSGTTGQSKGVVLSAEGCIRAGSDTVAFDHLTERDEALAYLPLAWVGDHYLNYVQGTGLGLLHGLPGKRRHRDAGPARDRPDILFRAAAHLRADAHPRHDPHGGRRLPQAPPVPLFHRRRAALWRGDPQPPAGAAGTAGCSMRSAISWSMRR